MRLIGLLISLAAVGLVIYMYLHSSNMPTVNGVQTKPAEYIDQAKQSVGDISKAIQNQQDQLNKAKK